MKILACIVISFCSTMQLFAIDPVGKIAKANAAKERAEEALKEGNYEEVLKHYSYLLDSLQYESPAAELNRAHAFFQLKDTVNAFDAYRKLSNATDLKIKSKAMLQMGNLSEMQQEHENALTFYKEALKANPSNHKARYNYELLKKKMQEQEKQNNQDQQNQENKEDQGNDKEEQDKGGEEQQDSENQKNEKDQEKSKEGEDSQEQQQKDSAEQQEGNKGEEENGEEQKQEQQQQQESDGDKEGEQQEISPSTRKKLEDMNMSQEKAEMILEALSNKQTQYLQQLRKKATKRQDSGKPDW